MEDELTVIHEQEDSPGTPENGADSPFYGDEVAEPIAPSPKKSKRGAQKRVISVPIEDIDGSYRSKGDVYPPSDSWSWRKYGQKPIKGSPYPRGYYRCSSSKGCPARKQVERSRLDPTVLQITYSHEHNHSIPTTTNKHHHHHHRSLAVATAAASVTATAIITSDTVVVDIPAVKEESAVFANQTELEPDNSGFSDLTVELGWFSDVGSTTMIESSTIVDTKWSDSEVEVMLPIGEEDQSLFGDLGELPECSIVFRQRYGAETPCYGGTG